MENQTIEMIDVSKITPYNKNAKKHPKKQIRQIADSIREFGFNQPIVVDKEGIIIVGHGRYTAATEELSMQKVPVMTLDLSEEQAKAYRLADNKLNESDWDRGLVIEELKELSLPMVDLTGFSRDLLLENDDKDDVVPETPETPKSKLGDVYKLGRHKVVCGDSLKQETYKAILEEAEADMVFTDPPYNVNYKGRGKETSRGIENDNMDSQSFDAFLEAFFSQAVDHAKNGAGWYIFHSSSTQHQFLAAMEQADLVTKSQLIWNKPTASMGWGDYRWKHEPFFYAGKKDNKLVFYGDRTHSTVVDFHKSEKELIDWVKREKRLEVMGLATIWTMKRDSVNAYSHPTQKPVELITYAMANSSKAGDIVLDPFLGSGSTMIAAEKADRTCYGIELDPAFVDVIVQRYVDYTSQEEVIKNGEPEIWAISDNIKTLAEGVDSKS